MYLSRYRSKDPKALPLTVEEFRALKRTNPPMLGTLMRWEYVHRYLTCLYVSLGVYFHVRGCACSCHVPSH